MRLTVLALCSKKSRFDEKSGLATRNQRINRVSDPKNPIARSTNYIVSGSIGIIKSTQQLTLNHSVFRPPVDSQQSTVNNNSGETGIDIICQQHTRFCIPFAAVPMLCGRAWP